MRFSACRKTNKHYVNIVCSKYFISQKSQVKLNTGKTIHHKDQNENKTEQIVRKLVQNADVDDDCKFAMIILVLDDDENGNNMQIMLVNFGPQITALWSYLFPVSFSSYLHLYPALRLCTSTYNLFFH